MENILLKFINFLQRSIDFVFNKGKTVMLAQLSGKLMNIITDNHQVAKNVFDSIISSLYIYNVQLSDREKEIIRHFCELTN